jgi:hypothetical protein
MANAVNQIEANHDELQKQISELIGLLRGPEGKEDPVVAMGNSLAALAAAIVSQSEVIELLRSDVVNLANSIIERG